MSALSDTRANGHVTFLKEGLHVVTDGSTDTRPRTDGGVGDWNTDKAAEYVGVSDPLAAVAAGTAPSKAWYGRQPQCAARRPARPRPRLRQHGNGTWDGYLVGESVYGDDWWGSNATLRRPHLPDRRWAGSTATGTLSEWRPRSDGQIYATASRSAPVATVTASSTSITIDDTATTSPTRPRRPWSPSPAPRRSPPSSTSTPRPQGHFVTDALGTDQVQGAKLRFKVIYNGKVVYRNQMGAGQKALTSLRFDHGSGKHDVVILKNGVVDTDLRAQDGPVTNTG